MAKRKVLITGASKGIGLATAKRLAQNGFDVVGFSRSQPQDFPGRWVRCDISDLEASQTVLGELLAEGPIDCLVNNAGLPSVDKFGEVPLQQLRDSFELHAVSLLQFMQAVAPGMRTQQWGRIVNVLSTTLTGYSERTSYRAGKDAARSLTVSTALELARTGITVNGVAPGPTATAAYYGSNPPGSKSEKYWVERVPMGRFGREEEIAATTEFLLSEGAGFITGQVLFVDGGMSAGTVIEV